MLQAFSEHRRKRADPRGVNQTDVDQVAEVHAVLVAEGGQFDAHERGEREDPEEAGVFGFVDVRVGEGLLRAYLFAGEDEMDGLARAKVRPVEEDVPPARVAVDEPCRLKRLPRRVARGRVRRGSWRDEGRSRPPAQLRSELPTSRSV